MEKRKALLIGASGLIGSQLLEYLLNNEDYSSVIALIRKPLTVKSEKLRNKVVNFEDFSQLRENITPGNVIFCCIGTTMKNVKGDKATYRIIDFDIPIGIARQGIAMGYQQFILVSAVGADSHSSNFYLRLKGEVEDAIGKLPFEAIHIFRPSILIGKRKERRWGEGIAQILGKYFSFLLTGKWSKYKAISSNEVALGLMRAADSNKRGMIIYHYNEIISLQ
jgi:uncharacterized protein YbjT (DUF2867 family)